MSQTSNDTAATPRLRWGPAATSAGVEYRIWAPDHPLVAVEIVDAGSAVLRSIPAAPGPDGFHTVLDRLGRAGDLYRFRLGSVGAFPDPASRRQAAGVHGPSVVVDDSAFAWGDSGWMRPPFRDLVIYELHVGAFTPAGTFAAAIEKLPHLKRLHINAIEIMPIADFPGRRGWGYDGVLPYAPASCYGTPDDLRRLVDAAHQLGIAVILDVVYNHLGPDGNYLGLFGAAFYRQDRTTPWGAAINFDGPGSGPIRAFFGENPLYWMREFHIDGFRLDAIHEIHDESSTHLLREIADSVHGCGGYIIGEDPRNEARMVTPATQAGFGFDAVWADDFHHSVCVSQTAEQDSYYRDFTGTPSEVVETLEHGWLYRGRVSVAMEAERGTECRHLPPQGFVHCISNHDQAGNRAFGERLQARISPAAYRALSVLLCLTPYTPMLFMGQEWATTVPFTFFTDHHDELGPLVTAGRRQEFAGFADFQHPDAISNIPDPQAEQTFLMAKLPWQEPEATPHAGIMALYEACLHLRRQCALFRPRDRQGWRVEGGAAGVVSIRFGEGAGAFLLMTHLWHGARTSLAAQPVTSPPEGCRWTLRLSSNEFRFGGDGAAAFDPADLSLDFESAESLLLEAVPE